MGSIFQSSKSNKPYYSKEILSEKAAKLSNALFFASLETAKCIIKFFEHLDHVKSRSNETVELLKTLQTAIEMSNSYKISDMDWNISKQSKEKYTLLYHRIFFYYLVCLGTIPCWGNYNMEVKQVEFYVTELVNSSLLVIAEKLFDLESPIKARSIFDEDGLDMVETREPFQSSYLDEIRKFVAEKRYTFPVLGFLQFYLAYYLDLCNELPANVLRNIAPPKRPESMEDYANCTLGRLCIDSLSIMKQDEKIDELEFTIECFAFLPQLLYITSIGLYALNSNYLIMGGKRYEGPGSSLGPFCELLFKNLSPIIQNIYSSNDIKINQSDLLKVYSARISK